MEEDGYEEDEQNDKSSDEENEVKKDQNLLKENKKAKKTKKRVATLAEMAPLNLLQEKDTFFSKNCKYNPQFLYSFDKNSKVKVPYKKPHCRLLKHARQILEATLQTYGTDVKYFESFGKVITKTQVEDAFDSYIDTMDLKELLTYKFNELQVAPTSLTHNENGTARINISLPITYQNKRVKDVLNHEIGTHFVRKFNDREQQWFGNRGKYNLKSYIQTEEGLATINAFQERVSVFKDPPYLYTAALNYYAAYLASISSFQDLYQSLKKYITDQDYLWRVCVRVKRG